jgi:hypothetical protein
MLTFTHLCRTPALENTREIILLITCEDDPQHPLNHLWLQYAYQCIQPALDYLIKQQNERFREQLALYNAARLFNPDICKGYGCCLPEPRV